MTAETPIALEAEAAAIEEIARAQAAQESARREMTQAGSDFTEAEQARDDAIADQIRGVRDADKRLSAAIEQARSAATRRGDAEHHRDIAAKVERSATARRDQVRTALLDELAGDAQEYVAEFEQARAALDAPLREYVRTYNAARARWSELEVGCRARVQALDQERGHDRASSKVDGESTVPACPISPGLAAVILGVPCKPAVLIEGYAPDGPLGSYLAPSPPIADADAPEDLIFLRDALTGEINPDADRRGLGGQPISEQP